jgi:hypothetical protein
VNAPGLPEDARPLYGLSSFGAHNDLTALARRHFRGNHLVFGAADPDGAIPVLNGAMITMAFAISKAHEFSSATEEQAARAFMAMQPEIEKVRLEWIARNSSPTAD